MFEIEITKPAEDDIQRNFEWWRQKIKKIAIET